MTATRRETPKPASLLTVPEAALKLRCSRDHVYRLISTGALRSVNIAAGGARPKTRVREDDLAAFVDARTSAAL